MTGAAGDRDHRRAVCVARPAFWWAAPRWCVKACATTRAVLIHRGAIVGEYAKHELPNYDVFDEERYFEPDNRTAGVRGRWVRFGVVICEDFWFALCARMLPCRRRAGAAGPERVALPHEQAASAPRHGTPERVCSLGMPMLAANLVGGQDELVFDGLSFALGGATANWSASTRGFEPDDLLIADVHVGTTARRSRARARRTSNRPRAVEQQVYSRWCWACATTSARTAFRAC
jgi:predicted amidohydrolase